MQATTTEFDYQKYLSLLLKRQRLFLVVSLLIMTIGIGAVYLMPKKYEAKSTVFIEKSVVAELVKGIAVTATIEDKLKGLNYSLTSRTLLVKVIDELDLNLKQRGEAAQEELIKKIQGNLQIKLPKEKESLFVITYVDENPRVARDLVNALVRRYIEENTSTKREDSYGANQFLSDQSQAFREKLDKAEEAVNKFKRERGVLVTMEPSALQKDINDGQQRLDDLRIRRSQMETHLAGLKKQNPNTLKLNTLQKQLDELRVQYTDSYPEIQRLKAEIAMLQGASHGERSGPIEQAEQERVLAEIRALKAAEENLKSTIATNRSLLQSLPATRAQLEDLEREKNLQKGQYELLVGRQGQAEVSKQLEVQDKSANYRIVDPAVMPVKPVSPNRSKLLPMMMLVGIGGSFALLVLLDLLNKTVKTTRDLQALHLTVLARIPKIVDPVALKREQALNRRYYLLTGIYFLCLLGVVGLELAGLSLVDRYLNPAYVIATIKELR